MTKEKNLYMYLLLASILISGCATQRHAKSYQVLSHIETEFMDTLRLDTGAFKASQKWIWATDFNYIREDGSKVSQTYIEDYDYYVEWVIPPPLKFYTLYNIYYSNGSIKLRGYLLGDLEIGQWVHYDENGNVIKVEDKDAQYDAFDYNKVVQWLHNKGIVDVYTGWGKDGINYIFNKKNHQWIIRLGLNEDAGRDTNQIFSYFIDSHTGKVLQKVKITQAD